MTFNRFKQHVTTEPIGQILASARAYANSGCRIPAHLLGQLARRRSEWQDRDCPQLARAVSEFMRQGQRVRDIAAIGGLA
jgi:hypothetical protein